LVGFFHFPGDEIVLHLEYFIDGLDGEAS
jgi:hypothetical protein